MLQQVKWKLTRSLHNIVGRDPPTRPQAEAARSSRPTIHFLGEDRKPAELIKVVALWTLPGAAVIFGIWLTSTASAQTQLKIGSVVALLVVSFVSLMLLGLFLLWWYDTGRRILPAIGFGLLFSSYVWLFVAMVFFVIDEFFATKFGRSWADFKIPHPLQEPMAVALGVIFLLASLFLLRIIVQGKDSWAERFDHFKTFLAFFLAGISILATSKLDPLVRTNLGTFLRRHLGQWGQHANLIVFLGAIALASIGALVLPSREESPKVRRRHPGRSRSQRPLRGRGMPR